MGKVLESFIYIENPSMLETACAELKKASVLCVDTEFHRESTYYAEFALIQIASRDVCYLIDPLAIDDLTPLWDVILDPDILKVFHAARQDVEIIVNKTGKLPLPLFDTQVAAALLGFGLQVGFGNLVQKVTGKALPKAESFTDWLKRPLTESQLTYAADDVIYLMPVYQHLAERLQATARTDWLDEEQEVLCAAATYANDPEQMFWRVKGSNRLRPRQMAVLRELAAWRERAVQQRDLPRRRLIQDEPLLALARKTQLDEEQMTHIRGLNNGTVRRFGGDILAAWQRGQDCDKENWPQTSRSPQYSEGTEMRLELLMTLVRLRAEKVEIAANILASRNEVAALASWANHGNGNGNNHGKKTDWDSPPDNHCMRGWRKKLIGDDLLRMLRGELCLRLDPQTHMPVVDQPESFSKN
ncbi:MAG: ribonuclease D [Mariprofundaceae bacterium]|nr:ribonuclease D [Mariprofundaceae bacterium]